MLRKFDFRYFFVIFVLFLIDFLSKFVFADLSFSYAGWGVFFVLNKGSSFSIFSGVSWYNFFIVFLSFCVLFFVFVFNERLNLFYCFEVFFVAGVLGNLVDRLFFGAVRDFILTPFFVFNVADFYLNVSLCVLLYNLYIKKNL